MPILQYETRVSPDGTIVLPPEYHNRMVVVLMDEERESPVKEYGTGRTRDDDWRPDPATVCQFMESWELLPAVEITDEEIEQLKHERRMRKML